MLTKIRLSKAIMEVVRLYIYIYIYNIIYNYVNTTHKHAMMQGSCQEEFGHWKKNTEISIFYLIKKSIIDYNGLCNYGKFQLRVVSFT